MRTDVRIGCTPLINWINFAVSLMAESRIHQESSELIPDPLGWHTCNKSIDALMDLGSGVVTAGYKRL